MKIDSLHDARCIETHISRVFLTDRDAWKTKKPVRFGFVDYTSLEARKHFCEQELRLNRRLAPSLYLGVDTIEGKHGEVVDYAVHMRRFPEGALFSEMLDAHMLAARHVDALGDLLGRFHLTAPRAPGNADFGGAGRRTATALAALQGAAPSMSGAQVATLRSWLHSQSKQLSALWEERRRQGAIREGHGDLHLDNIVLVDGEVMAFDGIEFDPALRWIDVIDDIAFAVMDFEARGRRDLAFRLLDRWLEHTGEHAGVPALACSCVYRALVRSQVGVLRGDSNKAQLYADAALRWTQSRKPRLAITHGLPGSGKTFQSQKLLEHDGAIRLRSDVERKRLFGLGALDRSRERGIDMYTAEATQKTYDVLFGRARTLLEAGWPVVLDAAFLRRGERDRARHLAAQCGVPFSIVHCEADSAVLRERLRARDRDASEADERVLDQLAQAAEPLADGEIPFVVSAAAPL